MLFLICSFTASYVKICVSESGLGIATASVQNVISFETIDFGNSASREGVEIFFNVSEVWLRFENSHASFEGLSLYSVFLYKFSG